MTRSVRATVCLAGLAMALAAGGCMPTGDSPLDEQKEPHFITGKNLATQMDYQGAIDAFEKALDVNPRSASAHFELAWLYENKAIVPDPAAAIFHYDRFLKLSPRSDKADLVRAHINSCKLEIAKTVSSFTPWPGSAQHDLENLMLENRNLKSQLAQLQAAAARAAAAPPSAAPQLVSSHPLVIPASAPSPEFHPPITAAAASEHAAASATARTHTVRAHETPTVIAREYGISTAALMAANPRIQPTRLHIGQCLTIPAP